MTTRHSVQRDPLIAAFTPELVEEFVNNVVGVPPLTYEVYDMNTMRGEIQLRNAMSEACKNVRYVYHDKLLKQPFSRGVVARPNPREHERDVAFVCICCVSDTMPTFAPEPVGILELICAFKPSGAPPCKSTTHGAGSRRTTKTVPSRGTDGRRTTKTRGRVVNEQRSKTPPVCPAVSYGTVGTMFALHWMKAAQLRIAVLEVADGLRNGAAYCLYERLGFQPNLGLFHPEITLSATADFALDHRYGFTDFTSMPMSCDLHSWDIRNASTMRSAPPTRGYCSWKVDPARQERYRRIVVWTLFWRFAMHTKRYAVVDQLLGEAFPEWVDLRDRVGSETATPETAMSKLLERWFDDQEIRDATWRAWIDPFIRESLLRAASAAASAVTQASKKRRQ